MTKSQRTIQFITKVLPRLPWAIKCNGKIYVIRINRGYIEYVCKKEVAISVKENCNLEAGLKILKWIENNDVEILKNKYI